jgi:hypothetical protein
LSPGRNEEFSKRIDVHFGCFSDIFQLAVGSLHEASLLPAHNGTCPLSGSLLMVRAMWRAVLVFQGVQRE